MALPRKVREAEEKAAALHKQFYENPPVNEDPPADPLPEPDPTPADPPPVPDDGTSVVPPNEPPEPTKEEPWEQRYRVIEGKYRAEVPRLASENKELKTQIQNLYQEIESLKSQAVQAAHASLITDADKEKYGDDLLDVIKRATQQATAGKDAEIAELKKTMQNFAEKNAQNTEVSFYQQLNDLAPEWVDINSDENFLRWLDEYDDLSGMTRQDLLTNAEQNRDAKQVAKFFNKFKAEAQARSNHRHTPAAAQHQVPDGNKRVSAPPGKRYFTRQEISQFYYDCRAGKIPAKQQVEMEAEIHSASLEGRIR